MNNACPSCGITYIITAKDQGRRIRCTQCQADLLITPTGFSTSPSPELGPNPPQKKSLRQLVLQQPLLLLGVGLTLVLVFHFGPQISLAQVQRQKSLQSEEQFLHERQMRLLREQPGNEQRMSQLEEAWQLRRDDLDAQSQAADFAQRRSGYWDRYGLMIGWVLVVAGGSLMLRLGQSLLERIFAAVIITLVLFFLLSAGFSSCARLPEPIPQL